MHRGKNIELRRAPGRFHRGATEYTEIKVVQVGQGITGLSPRLIAQLAPLHLIFKSVLVYHWTVDILPAALDVLFEDAIARDRTTARRAALLNILQHERFLTREQLIVRVEGKLGNGCFGDTAWVDTFFRDMQIVKRALRAAGYQVAYSRNREHPGYYLRNQPDISREISSMLAGSVAEVDRSQIAIFKQLSTRQRFQQGCSISDLARQVVAYRIQQRNPRLSPAEAHQQAIRGVYSND